MLIWKKLKQAVDLVVSRLDDEEQGAMNDEIQSVFKECKKELQSLGHVFSDNKSWEKTIMDKFCDLEQKLYNDIFKEKSEVKESLRKMTVEIKELHKLVPSVDKGKESAKSTSKPSDVAKEWVDNREPNELKESFNNLAQLKESFNNLTEPTKTCSLCLSVFPMNSTIDKRPLIYWWMGEGLLVKKRENQTAEKVGENQTTEKVGENQTAEKVGENQTAEKVGENQTAEKVGENQTTEKVGENQTAEDVGEQVFEELLKKKFIRPSSNKMSLSVSSFIIDPGFHKILKDEENSKLRAFLGHIDNTGGERTNIDNTGGEANDVMTVFNVNQQYLQMEPYFTVNGKQVQMKPEWLSNLKKVEVLHMGRWQTCAADNHIEAVDHHIEVVDQTLLNRLGSQKDLKYLSLRGISRIETLPASISKLLSLQILDLRACHNLEKLPSSISKLKNLTHLDVSHCYLLESMPKGLENLAALQVLKGFVIGKAVKNACKISDLKELANLRKLSIRVGNAQQDDKQLKSLGDFRALSILTISWGTDSDSTVNSVILPPKLTKLDLRSVPFKHVPQWLKPPRAKLVKLYIIGGKLKSLIEDWNVEFLRLKYLKDLEGEWANYGYLDNTTSYEVDQPKTSNLAATQHK